MWLAGTQLLCNSGLRIIFIVCRHSLPRVCQWPVLSKSIVYIISVSWLGNLKTNSKFIGTFVTVRTHNCFENVPLGKSALTFNVSFNFSPSNSLVSCDWLVARWLMSFFQLFQNSKLSILICFVVVFNLLVSKFCSWVGEKAVECFDFTSGLLGFSFTQKIKTFETTSPRSK